MAVSGVVNGTWHGLLPVRVDTNDDLVVELVVLDDEAPLLAMTPFLGCTLTVPGASGAGSYDLQAIARRRQALGQPELYEGWQAMFGNQDEPFYWTPETGPARIEVGPNGQTLTAQLRMEGAAGAIDLSVNVSV